MPGGISKLKHLHTLDFFVVGKHEDNKIQELGGLSNLHGSLELKKLENIVDVKEAENARMTNKNLIDKLYLEWSSGDDMVSNTKAERDIFDSLQPHNSMKELTIKGYKAIFLAGDFYCNSEELGKEEEIRIQTRHLGTSLEEMPRKMSKLNQLYVLSSFVVGKHEDNGIQELGGLVNLHGCLEIKKLENIVDVKEAKRAKIMDKKHIDELCLEWSSGDDIVSSTQKERDILDNLQPQNGLKELKIKGYKGEGLAAPNLTHLQVRWCEKLEALPRDMKSLLPSLQSLEISGYQDMLLEGYLPPNLKSLEVGICEQQMRDLSWMGNLHALTHLTILGSYCDNIKSYPEMQNPVKEFVSKLLPNWIICDFHPHWIVEIAQELHVKLMYFSVYSASTIVFYGPPDRMRAKTSPEDLTSPREWMNFLSSVAFQRNEAIAFYQDAYVENVSGLRDIDRFAKMIGASNAVSFRSCYEMEGEYLNLYQELIGKPVIPIGLLPLEKPERRFVDESWSKTFEWLDAQETKSVVFVGFGSECKLTKEQVFEIAYGLELSEFPFLWTLRKPSWTIHDHDSLPLGFCERTSKRGKLAWDQMQNPVKEFVSKLQPNWIICDFHAHWTVVIAQELHVKLMYFSVYSASTIVFFGPPGRMRAPTLPEVLTSPREWVNFPSSVAFQRNEAIAFYQSAYIENVTGLRDIDRIASVIDGANALSFRSCYEMEGEYLNLYQELIEKPVIPIGLLPPEMPERRFVDESWSKTFEWLDAQATKSVVFVGFGSECKLSKEQVFEIAYGLELSELPFLWTLRKPSWAIHDHDSLPLGFCERTSKRGKVYQLCNKLPSAVGFVVWFEQSKSRITSNMQ
ncbi:hypothetical protein AHAS_Ahas02G0012100 [Arachis hypogaea]